MAEKASILAKTTMMAFILFCVVKYWLREVKEIYLISEMWVLKECIKVFGEDPWVWEDPWKPSEVVRTGAEIAE